MNSKELHYSFLKNKGYFYSYVNKIKQNSSWDIFTIINPTLIKNPYSSILPDMFFKQAFASKKNINKILLILKSFLLYYIKAFYYFLSYLVATLIFKIYGKKCDKNKLSIVVDVFALVDIVNKNNYFYENYFIGIYEIFEKFNVKYSLLLRPYNVTKNPFKLKKFLKIINNDERNFILEYEFLNPSDFINIFYLFALYPFKILGLMQKDQSKESEIFNYCLIYDLTKFDFGSFTRYILGKKLASMSDIKRIYSWSEFQSVERSFNYAIRKHNDRIEICALQFFLSYDTYLNVVIDDLDYDMLSSPHKVFVNGNYYLRDTKKVLYNVGVSLRYLNVFDFTGIKSDDYILCLGSYLVEDTKNIISYLRHLKDDVVFKKHPATNLDSFGVLPNNFHIVDDNLCKLFENTKILVCSATGAALEAVACGLSVIIIANNDSLTANPLIENGKGEIWDIAYNIEEFDKIYENLLDFRKKNKSKILAISKFYKDNFFIEPTEDKIIEVFELNDLK